MKKAMMNKAKKKICLVDSSKFGLTKHKKVFSFQDVDKIITDNEIDKKILDKFNIISEKIVIAE